jgi:integrase
VPIFLFYIVILNHAVEDGIIEHNPAAKFCRFTKTQKPKHQAEAMTREEACAFLDAVQEVNPELYPLFLMALRAGLRKGELIAVKWATFRSGKTRVTQIGTSSSNATLFMGGSRRRRARNLDE